MFSLKTKHCKVDLHTHVSLLRQIHLTLSQKQNNRVDRDTAPTHQDTYNFESQVSSR